MDSNNIVYFKYEWLGEKKIGTKIREVKLSDGTTRVLMSDNSSDYKYPINKKNVKKVQ